MTGMPTARSSNSFTMSFCRPCWQRVCRSEMTSSATCNDKSRSACAETASHFVSLPHSNCIFLWYKAISTRPYNQPRSTHQVD